MKRAGVIFAAMMCGLVLLSLQACVAGGQQLVPRSAEPASLKGTYTLMLYGCRNLDDLENMAILVDESSPYHFGIYSLDSMYKVKKGLSGPQALSGANEFVACSMNPLWQTVLRAIPDGAGRIIAYELKPLYRDIVPPETLLSSYALKNGKVTAYIQLDPSLENKNSGGDDWDSNE